MGGGVASIRAQLLREIESIKSSDIAKDREFLQNLSVSSAEKKVELLCERYECTAEEAQDILESLYKMGLPREGKKKKKNSFFFFLLFIYFLLTRANLNLQ
jgi:hypothetical protein